MSGAVEAMAAAMNLELRKGALEACGWKAARGNTCGRTTSWFYLVGPDGEVVEGSGHWLDDFEAFTKAPAVEMDDGLALKMLDEYCAPRKLIWSIGNGTAERHGANRWCEIQGNKFEPHMWRHADTTAQAICMLVVAIEAARKEKE
jgi:hypothetical protein